MTDDDYVPSSDAPASDAASSDASDSNPHASKAPATLTPWQRRLHEVIFEADTAAGRAFDVALLWAIVLSVSAVMLESIESVRDAYGPWLLGVEWLLTIAFTVEYVVRLACVGRPLRYAVSFFGVIDLLSIVPTYLSLIFAGTQSLAVIRALRLLRVFRVLKLAHYTTEAQFLLQALRTTRRKIVVFLLGMLTIVLIMGSLMYLIEGPANGFTSIPMGVYWAIVTVTTVGYGDVAPKTELGQAVAALVMIIGYSIIIVPTGIFSAEIVAARLREVSTQACPACSLQGHDVDAVHCKYCGAKL